jgi:pilus assembly protein CpaD
VENRSLNNKLSAGAARTALVGAALTLVTAMSAGCTSWTSSTHGDPMLPYDSERRHPILISNEPETFDMRVGMNGPALSPQIETAVREYVSEYRSDGTGSITIQVPSGSANEVAAAATGHALHYALVRAGVPRGHISVAPYEVGDHAELAPLRLSYLRVKAVVPSCGIWPETEQNPINNSQYHNFGCATNQNLAAMVANPADLLRPRPMTPADGGRRANVMQIYVDTGNVGWEPQPANGLLGEPQQLGGN